MQKSHLLKSAKQELLIRNYSKRSIASYLSAINHFANWLITRKVTKVSKEIVENYLYDLKTNKKHQLFDSVSSSCLTTVFENKTFEYLELIEESLNCSIKGVTHVRIIRQRTYQSQTAGGNWLNTLADQLSCVDQ